MCWLDEEITEYQRLAQAITEDSRHKAGLERICARVVDALMGGGKIMTLGNGGSAADATHLSEELCGRYRADRAPLAALSLACDGPTLSCIGDVFGAEQIFARQVEALCCPGDAVVVFSTSGNSENVIQALRTARSCGGVTLGLLGRDGGRCLSLCDESFLVPSENTARIQEIHGLALHLICEAVERQFTK